MSYIASVDGFLWRGSRPDPSEFAGIKAKFPWVISLEGTAEDKKEAVELFPSKLVSNPISFWEIYFTGISQKELLYIIAQIKEAPTPVLVHCQHGQDRTGLVVAAYRVLVCGWTKVAAMKEAVHLGYRNYLNHGLNETWEAFEP